MKSGRTEEGSVFHCHSEEPDGLLMLTVGHRERIVVHLSPQRLETLISQEKIRETEGSQHVDVHSASSMDLSSPFAGEGTISVPYLPAYQAYRRRWTSIPDTTSSPQVQSIYVFQIQRDQSIVVRPGGTPNLLYNFPIF